MGDDHNALATGALCRLDGKSGHVLDPFPEVGDFVLLGNHLHQFRAGNVVLGCDQFGLQLVVYQRVGMALVVPGNVIHIAPVHIEHAAAAKLPWSDPPHQS